MAEDFSKFKCLGCENTFDRPADEIALLQDGPPPYPEDEYCDACFRFAMSSNPVGARTH